MGLILPPEFDRGERGECYLCGEVFTSDVDTVRHMRVCVSQAGHEVRAAEYERRERLWMFQEENWDPEVAAHLKQVGKRMLAEGRWEVHPNERAGFS